MGRRGRNLLHLHLPSDSGADVGRRRWSVPPATVGGSSDWHNNGGRSLRMMDPSWRWTAEPFKTPEIRPLRVQRSSATPATAVPCSNGVACQANGHLQKKSTRQIVKTMNSSEVGNWVADFSSSEVGNWVADFSSLEVVDRCRFQNFCTVLLLTWKI